MVVNDVQEPAAAGPAAASPAGETARARQRASLIEAAEATIARSGLSALRARDLARETGCAVGTLYNLFAGLDGLVLAANGRTLAALDRRLRSAGEGGDPEERLVALALAYLDFATEHRSRWSALFEHRLAEGREVPQDFAAALARLFGHVEAPLAAAVPGGVRLDDLARSVFSAIHGVVALGLSEKLATVAAADLRAQVEVVARALARGLSAAAEWPTDG